MFYVSLEQYQYPTKRFLLSLTHSKNFSLIWRFTITDTCDQSSLLNFGMLNLNVFVEKRVGKISLKPLSLKSKNECEHVLILDCLAHSHSLHDRTKFHGNSFCHLWEISRTEKEKKIIRNGIPTRLRHFPSKDKK